MPAFSRLNPAITIDTAPFHIAPKALHTPCHIPCTPCHALDSLLPMNDANCPSAALGSFHSVTSHAFTVLQFDMIPAAAYIIAVIGFRNDSAATIGLSNIPPRNFDIDSPADCIFSHTVVQVSLINFDTVSQ